MWVTPVGVIHHVHGLFLFETLKCPERCIKSIMSLKEALKPTSALEWQDAIRVSGSMEAGS
jgi:hypothetical protein